MTCPLCGSKTRIDESHAYTDHVVRFRKCQKCKFRFRTLEMDDDLYYNLRKEKNHADRK
jgi:transcriptional regulator NrdR family protein